MIIEHGLIERKEDKRTVTLKNRQENLAEIGHTLKLKRMNDF